MKNRLLQHTILTIILCFTSVMASVAQTTPFRGQVVDTQKEPIPYSHIMCTDNGAGVASNQFGFFVLKHAPKDSVHVEVKSVGFEPWQGWLKHNMGTVLIVLQEKTEEIESINVVQVRNGNRMQRIDNQHLGSLPSSGSGGVETLVKTMPGVYSSNELSSQYNVRGGNFDENLIYVNGIEVYRPLLVKTGQQEGLSFIAPQMVENINFSSGGFDAIYGDKMSSVLDVRYKRPTETEGKVEASLLGASAYLGGAIGKKKRLTHSTSVRYKTTEYILNSMDETGNYKPKNIDFQTYLSYQFNPKLSMDVYANIASNEYEFVPQTRETQFGTLFRPLQFTVYYDGREEDLFRTSLAATQFTYRVTPKHKVTLQGSAWETREEINYDIQSQYLLNELEYDPSQAYPDSALNLGIGSQIEHARNKLDISVYSASLKGKYSGKHTLEYGFGIKSERIKDQVSEWEMRDSADYSMPKNPELLTLYKSVKAKNEINSIRMDGYLQAGWDLSGAQWSRRLNTGFRFQYWDLNEETIISPRFSYAFYNKDKANTTYRLSWGVYQQMPFYKEMQRMDGSLKTEDIEAQKSIHYAFALDHDFLWHGRRFKLSSEAYYKQLKHLTPYQIDNLEIQYLPDLTSEGYTGGIDLKLNGEFIPGTESWVSVSLMKTEEDIEGDTMPIVNDNGETIGEEEVGYLPRPTDQRFMFSMFFQDYLPGNDRMKMNILYSFGTGKPFGPSNGNRYQDQFRMPSYQRVDVGLNYDLTKARRFREGKLIKRGTLGLEIFNLFNKSNTASYYWATTYDGQMYAVPNYLSTRRLNVKLAFEF